MFNFQLDSTVESDDTVEYAKEAEFG